MGLLSDFQITMKGLSVPDLDVYAMISPFCGASVKEENGSKIISYGLSSYGYDIRVADEYKIFTNVNSTVTDPKQINEDSMINYKGDVCIIPPNSFVLARSVEYMRMPRNVTGVVLCKSTYIRAGVLIPTTVLEAGWCGIITLEIANVTPIPVKIYSNEGIAQILFFEGDDNCITSYADRAGKYQDQTGITLGKV